jgi:NTE family protein
MSRVGIVLGGGGITGASFHFGVLFSLQMATGWDPAEARTVVGTSSGAVVAALLRTGHLDVGSLVGEAYEPTDLADGLRDRVYRRSRPRGVGRWLRHGVLPSLRRPGIGLAFGSPAPYTTDGIVEWLEELIGPEAHTWPDRPTTIVAYQLEGRHRVAFGTESSPDTGLARAVAASAAVPMLFEPVEIDGARYVDGGVASGTSADLVLGGEPLDLVIVSAPMASTESRPGARFYEGIVDRLGSSALDGEVEAIHRAWPETDVLVLRPDAGVLAETRPNPLDTHAALPAFLRTLRSMRSRLSSPEVWEVLERHLSPTRKRLPWGRRLRLSAFER